MPHRARPARNSPVFLALDPTLAPIAASPKQRAHCPLCREPVLSKCGEIVDWHWAHVVGGDCDPWSEPETPWHRWWKERAPVAWREVTVGEHRADIRRPDDRVVIELQHSPITADEIRTREAFYGHMVWLLDGRMLAHGMPQLGEPTPRLWQVRPGTWRWLWPRRVFQQARRKVFIDLGTSVLESKGFEDVSNRRPGRSGLANGFYVHGEVTTREAFLKRARLRAVEDEEQSQTVGFIAEWRSTPRARRPRSVRDLYRPVHAANLHRREFRSEELLRSWADRAPRADLSLLRWRGDGSVVEVDARPKSAGDQQPAE